VRSFAALKTTGMTMIFYGLTLRRSIVS
jgi:hypothetical protein